MLGSSSTDLDAPSPALISEMATHRRDWAARWLSTHRADRAAAEAGVALAYTSAGLARPERILWCEGPIELARAWACDRRSATTGPNVRTALADRMRARSMRLLRRRLGSRFRRAISDAQRPWTDTLGADVARAVARQTRERPAGTLARMREVLSSLIHSEPNGARWSQFGRASINPFEMTWLWPPRLLSECCGLSAETSYLDGHWLIATETGWMIPHAHVCWLADRPTAIGVDARGRLHGERGPALAYRDGFVHYAWKGFEVPSVLIEAPERITLSAIDDAPDPIMRCTMIDILTPQRFVEMGGAVVVGRDAAGILWRRSWWSGDSWAAVEVINGTREPDGTQRRYFLQVPAEINSPIAAVAWTYGVREDQYAKMTLRT